MPVVRTKLSRLMELTGIGDIEELRRTLFNLKCETEIEEGGVISIEVQSDRIDMFSVEGIVYAVRLYRGLESPRRLSARTVFKVYVDPPAKRPYIAVAAVRNVRLDEESLKELIEFQERLHTTYGRNRRRVAIGLHDLSKLPQGVISYREVDIDSVKMVPLFSDKRISLREVLETTEQGKIYGAISIHGNRHPALMVGDEVIALPPVINSDITRLEPTTRDIFIDVTGTDIKAVLIVLNAIVHALSFYGGEILGAEVHYPNEKVIITPALEEKRMLVDIDFASKWLGVPREIIVGDGINALKRMGYLVDKVSDKHIEVTIPMYRCDILHQVDVVEDIAIGLGYDNLGLELIERAEATTRKPLARVLVETLRQALVGLGYVEVNTSTLVPLDLNRMVVEEPCLAIVNALSKELNAVRNSLIPSLLMVLRDSQYIAQPVKVFEVGEVVERCEHCYNGWTNKRRAAFAVMDSEIKFEEIHADLYAVLRELGLEGYIRVEPCISKAFINGRSGCMKYSDRVLGVIGEIHPGILRALGIEYPIAMVELYVDEILGAVTSLKLLPAYYATEPM